MEIASLHRITALSSMPPQVAITTIEKEKKITEIKDEALNSLSNYKIPFSQRSIVSAETPADPSNPKKLAGILPPELYAEVFSFCAPSANLACVHPSFVDCNEKTSFSATFLLDALQKYETAKETNDINKKHYLTKINALIKNKHLAFSPEVLKKIISILYLHDIHLNSLVKYVLKKRVETFPDLYKKQIDLAARYGLTAEMTKLIKNPQATGKIIDDVFFVACMSGQHEIVSLLLTDKRVDPSTDHNNAIRLASINGHAEVVKLLLADKRVDPSADNNRAIRSASYNGHEEVVRLFLADTRVDPSADNNWAIRLASRNGHAEVVRLLLDDTRVDPSADNNWAIRWSSRKESHAEVVRLLLNDTRVDPSADNSWAIRLASLNGHAEVVRLLLDDTRVDPSADNNWAIRFASENGHAEVVRLLLANTRVDPSAGNNWAIRFASENGHTEVVKLLLSNTKVLNTLDSKTLAEMLMDAKARNDLKIVNVIEWHLKMDSFVTKQVLSRIFKPIAVIALTAAVSSVINYINTHS